MAASLGLNLEIAQKLVSQAFPDSLYTHVIRISEISTKTSFGYSPRIRTFIIDLSSNASTTPTHTTFLTVSLSSVEDSIPVPYLPNSLAVFQSLVSLIRSQTPIPLAPPILDESLSLPEFPHAYILTPPERLQSSSIISLSSARKQNLLSSEQEVLVDLGLGQLLGQLHSKVQNDFYGRAVTEGVPKDPSYSWQETFTTLLESVFVHFEGRPNAEITSIISSLRPSLARAIAFYLFDDVEVPSLVWFTGSEDDIFIFKPLPSSNPKDPPTIAAFLPNLTHAIWGDPLLETFFLSSSTSSSNSAMMQGYVEGGGLPLLAFARQKTKRLWYTVFLAFLTLIERAREEDDKTLWALQMLKECVDKLKDAPCY
ncbi:hypothetical protein VKT23_020079 [Stygiomarasmius scandens]|uniref:Aminoglycoside phosphotransferase domain-containing protein n=1 Tax=Marasmiellus scandens TaxID=2682957 RepID=A0ABR1INY2_9AGAR